jgi:hypothetical protein
MGTLSKYHALKAAISQRIKTWSFCSAVKMLRQCGTNKTLIHMLILYDHASEKIHVHAIPAPSIAVPGHHGKPCPYFNF